MAFFFWHTLYNVYNVCGVAEKRRTSDPNVTGSRPPQDMHCVLLVNSQNKFNLLSWLMIYLYNKQSALHQTFKK